MSDKNIENLPAQLSEKSGQLANGGMNARGLIDNALANLNKEQAQTLMGKAAEEALRLEVKQREQSLDYVAGKKTIEDHIETFEMLDKRGKLTRQSVVTDVKTGAGNMRIESKSGAACFVATAAFGDADHAHVRFLRRFRDDVLSRSGPGRSFIKWYWQIGPVMAIHVGRSNILQSLSRICLSGVVRVLKLLKY